MVFKEEDVVHLDLLFLAFCWFHLFRGVGVVVEKVRGMKLAFISDACFCPKPLWGHGAVVSLFGETCDSKFSRILLKERACFV